MDIRSLLCSEDRSAVEAYVRSQTKVVSSGGDRVIARALDSFLLYLDMRDTSIAPHLAMDGYWEMWATIAVARYVREGMRCIDVGASFGYYSMLLATLVGDKGHVQAWEPLDAAWCCLKDSVSVNGMSERLDLLHMAAGDAVEMRRITTPGSRLGSSKLVGPPLLLAGSPSDERLDMVAVDTLDNRQLTDAPVDFIKIDAEGFEASVWAGLKKILAQSPKVAVMMEFTPEDHPAPPLFLDRIRADGFSVRTIADNGNLAPIGEPELLVPGVKLLWLSR